MDYTHKYHKYKQKYLNLKSIHQKGGFDEEIKNVITDIDAMKKSFGFVDTNLTNNEKQIIQSLIIKDDIENLEINYYGVYHRDKLLVIISKFVQQMGNTVELANDAAKILDKIISSYLKATERNSLWFTIRIMYPNAKYQIPRWHCDGYFYKPHEYANNKKPQIKMAGVIKGTGTLFKKDNDQARNKYLEIETDWLKKYGKNYDELEQRKYIDQELDKIEKNNLQPSNQQIAIFTVGDHNCTIHSEPNITEKRFFYSIVAGTSDEINELSKRRNLIFTE